MHTHLYPDTRFTLSHSSLSQLTQHNLGSSQTRSPVNQFGITKRRLNDSPNRYTPIFVQLILSATMAYRQAQQSLSQEALKALCAL